MDPETIYVDLLWPTHEMIERLFRSDQMSVMAHNMATRLLRVLVDQAAGMLISDASLPKRRVLAMCGANEQSELGAQMAVDLLEANGMEVCFAGGGVANDEVLARVNETKPDVLVWFSSVPTDLPDIRAMIDHLHEIDACPDIQIAVGVASSRGPTASPRRSAPISGPTTRSRWPRRSSTTRPTGPRWTSGRWGGPSGTATPPEPGRLRESQNHPDPRPSDRSRVFSFHP